MVQRPCSEDDRWENTGLRAVGTQIHTVINIRMTKLIGHKKEEEIILRFDRRKLKTLTSGFNALDISRCPQEVAA